MSAQSHVLPRVKLTTKRRRPPNQWKLWYASFMAFALDSIARIVFIITSRATVAMTLLLGVVLVYWCLIYTLFRRNYTLHKWLEEHDLPVSPPSRSAWMMQGALWLFFGILPWVPGYPL